MTKPFSNLTAAQLIAQINTVTGGDQKAFDVFIEEQTSSIVIVNRETCEGTEIPAARKHYRCQEYSNDPTK